ncbi:MAG: DUF4403 family protein [Nitrospira sp.]|nr:DUF4403 family protein [Nitrospira sp.]
MRTRTGPREHNSWSSGGSHQRYSVVWLVALSCFGCSLGPAHIEPSAPDSYPAMKPPALATTESVVRVPVRTELVSLRDALNDEQVIPQRFDQWVGGTKTPQGIEYKYYAERGDFTINSSPSSLPPRKDISIALRDWWKGIEPLANIFVSAPLRYKIQVNPKTVPAGVPYQCGGGNEGLSQAVIGGFMAVDLAPDLTLTTTVNDVSIQMIDPCPLGGDEVTVVEAFKNMLRDAIRPGMQQAVARLSKTAIRDQVKEVWTVLHKPVRLNPDAWLLFNVERLAHRGLLSEGHHLNDVIHIVAKPVILFGDQPGVEATVLPPLDPRPAVMGFRVATDVRLDYQKLSDALVDRLRGERVSNEDRSIIITDISMRSNGGNQVVMRVDFRGDAYGHVYFVGKPRLNPLTQTVYFENLRYDKATAQQLGKSASWLFRSMFREFIATEAVVGVTQATKKMQSLIAPILNQRLTPDLVMQGKLSSFQAIGVFADETALQVRVVADGTLDLLTSEGS